MKKTNRFTNVVDQGAQQMIRVIEQIKKDSKKTLPYMVKPLKK